MKVEHDLERRLAALRGSVPGLPTLPRWALKALSVLGFLSLWWALVEVGLLGFDLLSTPPETLRALLSYLAGQPLTQGGHSLYTHSYYTVYRVGLGIGLGAAVGIPVGLAVGWSDWWRHYVYPAVEVLRPIPPVAWVPIALIAFQTELTSIVWVVFVGAFFPISINTMEGVMRIEAEYVRAVRSLGGGRLDLYRHVVIPHTLPSIVTGTMIGVGIGWIAVVAAEMLSGNYGVGYVTFQAYRLMNTETVIVGIVVLGTYGAASSAAVAAIGDRLMPWYEEVDRS